MRRSISFLSCLVFFTATCTADSSAQGTSSGKSQEFCVPALPQLLPNSPLPLPLPKTTLITEEEFDDANVLPINYSDRDFRQFLAGLSDADSDSPSARQLVAALKGRNGEKIRKDVQCTVCLACLHADSLATPNCGHYLHDACMKNIQNNLCPICRAPFEASRGFDKNTSVKQILEFFEAKQWIPHPESVEESAPVQRVETPTLGSAEDIDVYVKERARYHSIAFGASLSEMTSAIRTAAGINVKHLIGGLLNLSLRTAGLRTVTQVVDFVVFGRFAFVDDRLGIFEYFHVIIDETLILAGARHMSSRIPRLPTFDEVANLHGALIRFDALNQAFAGVVRDLLDEAEGIVAENSLVLVEVIDRLYDWLMERMAPVRNISELGHVTKNFKLHRLLLDDMRRCLAEETSYEFASRYVQYSFHTMSYQVRRSEAMYN